MICSSFITFTRFFRAASDMPSNQKCVESVMRISYESWEKQYLMRYVVSSSFNDCQGLAVNPGFHLRRHSTSDAIIFYKFGSLCFWGMFTTFQSIFVYSQIKGLLDSIKSAKLFSHGQCTGQVGS